MHFPCVHKVHVHLNTSKALQKYAYSEKVSYILHKVWYFLFSVFSDFISFKSRDINLISTISCHLYAIIFTFLIVT